MFEKSQDVNMSLTEHARFWENTLDEEHEKFKIERKIRWQRRRGKYLKASNLSKFKSVDKSTKNKRTEKNLEQIKPNPLSLRELPKSGKFRIV